MRISDWSSDVCSSDLSCRSESPQSVRSRIRAVPGWQHHADDSRYRGLSRQHLLHVPRSEEHTSELQSLMRISYAVFCLKKKKTPRVQSQSADHARHAKTVNTTTKHTQITT